MALVVVYTDRADIRRIISARVARETFGVQNVVARIYDPRRAEVYQRLGIPTVATVRWTVDQIIRRLLPGGAETEWRDPSGKVVLAEVAVHEGWVGERLTKLESACGARVAFVTRLGEAVLPSSSSVFQDGDLMHLLLPTDRVDAVTSVLAAEPED